MKNLLRVATATPKVHIGNVKKNCDEIKEIYNSYAKKADVILTPELSLTGYTCADLFLNRNLIDNAMKGLMEIAEYTEQINGNSAIIVGVPFEKDGELFNCGAFIHNGKIVAIIPKTYIPNYSELYEKRWFSGRAINVEYVTVGNQKVAFGNNVIIDYGKGGESVKLGIEICEDAFTPVSPGSLLALNGAEVIFNLSASNEVVGKEQYRHNMVSAVSSACICGYVYVSSGFYESTSDMVFGGHNIIYDRGKLLGEIKPFENGVLICDFDLNKIRHDRLVNNSFSDCKLNFTHRKYEIIPCESNIINKTDIKAKVSITPFVPSKNKLERCKTIFNMQVAGLQRRIEATRSKCVVVGVSGGLDSTLALLVSAQAVKNLNLPASTVMGITMPGFGTTNRTKNNSMTLMEHLGCDIKEISIVKATRQHFEDIGHDENIHDVTYENAQARERTQILMDIANKNGGFVVGTGDLSELVLGWCTYNGDQMSMYGVNAGIPKTLVRTLVDEIGHFMGKNGFDGIEAVIDDIIDTPVSPELLPPNPDGTIAQKTEDTVGSYILHDFFLYYTLRYGMAPAEVFELCKIAVKNDNNYKFDDEEIKKWLNVFNTRFFRQQFKRNCMPDGVKVGTVSVSPRGDLRLPSETELEEFLLDD